MRTLSLLLLCGLALSGSSMRLMAKNEPEPRAKPITSGRSLPVYDWEALFGEDAFSPSSQWFSLARAPVCSSRWHVAVHFDGSRSSTHHSEQVDLEGEFEIEALGTSQDGIPMTYGGTASWRDEAYTEGGKNEYCEWASASGGESLSLSVKLDYEVMDFGDLNVSYIVTRPIDRAQALSSLFPSYVIKGVCTYDGRYKHERNRIVERFGVPLPHFLPLQPGVYRGHDEYTTYNGYPDLNIMTWTLTLTPSPCCEITWVGAPPSQTPILCDSLNLPRVYARAPEGGSSYRWTILDGRDLVSIVSGESQQIVELELRNPSTRNNDVVIRVEYRGADGRTQHCSTSFSVLKPDRLVKVGEQHMSFPSRVEVERHYQVLSQLGETHPLCVKDLRVTETLRSININGTPVTWSSGTQELSYNPKLPAFLGSGAPLAPMTASSTTTRAQGDFYDTLRCEILVAGQLPAEMDFTVNQDIFVGGCLVGSYEIHFTHDRVSVSP